MERLLIPLTYLELCPFLVNVGRALEQRKLADVHYVAFTPLESTFARLNLSETNYTLVNNRVHGRNTPALNEEAVAYATEFVMKKHGGAAQHWARRSQALYAHLQAVIEQEQISLLLLWNGQDLPGRIAQLLARKHGLSMCFLENGYFSNTLQVDTLGVNASASICQQPMDSLLQPRALNVPQTLDRTRASPLPVIRHIPKRHHWLMGARMRLDPFFFQAYPELRYPINRKQPASERGLIGTQSILGRQRPFALVIVQVHDDTQLLLNSDHFKCPKTFVRHCAQAVKAVWQDDMDVVVKLHPADFGRMDYGDVMRDLPDLLWVGREPVEPLLAACKLMMVVNSSVGLQAIEANRPALVFGRSLYTRPELCFCIDSPEKTIPALRSIQQGSIPFEPSIQTRFVQMLKQRFFVEGSWRKPSVEQLMPLLNRLESMLGNSHG